MKIKVAASQFQTIKGNIKENINKAINLADQAVAEGVNIFLLQELFQSEYFCSTQNAKFF
jgi:predicted amidohydrolase